MYAQFNRPLAALVLRVVAAGLSFAFGIVAARLLGIENFGVVSVLLGLINVGVVLALLGHETLATREVAALHRNSDAGAAIAYGRSAARQIWLAGIVVALALLSLVSAFSIAGSDRPEFLALLLLVPLVARTRLSQGVIRGAHLAGLSLVPDGILRPGVSVLLLGLMFGAGLASERSFAPVMIVCAFLALFFGRRWERNALAMPSKVAPPGATSEGSPRLKFSMPIFVSAVISVLVAQVALIAAGVFATPTDAALYAAAERFSLAAALVGQAVYLAIASRVAALYAAQDIAALRALVRKVTRGVSALTILVCVALWLAAAPVLGLYGSGFDSAEPVLQVLLVSVALNACAGPTGQLLLMTRNEMAHLTAMTISLILQAALIVTILPVYGVLGAAWSVLLSTLVWNGLMMHFVRRRLALNPLLAWA